MNSTTADVHMIVKNLNSVAVQSVLEFHIIETEYVEEMTPHHRVH